MSRPAIVLDNIGKLYRLGVAERASSFREAIVDVFGSTFRKIRGFGEDREKGDDYWAIRGVSFEIQPGEAVGIVGRNGAGKSTLLKILSRITDPTEGFARLRGRVASLLEVGTGFHPDLTGRENIYLNGSILGMKRAEINRKFDEIVAFSEVERFLDTPVKRYSSGMYVRLAFAVAAHLEPEILLVDEVLAVGDMEFQKKCLGKMNEVIGHGRTVFFVSHNMQSVAALTKRCLIMKGGRLALDAPTDRAIREFIEMSTHGSALGEPYHNEKAADRNYVASARVITSSPSGEQIWGQPITFEFVLHVGDPKATLCFSFHVDDNVGRSICHFWLFNDGLPFRTASGDYLCRCVVPKMRLHMGKYTLTTWLSERRGNAIFENLTEICPFEVTMRGIVRDQFEWQEGETTYLEDSDWELSAL